MARRTGRSHSRVPSRISHSGTHYVSHGRPGGVRTPSEGTIKDDIRLYRESSSYSGSASNDTIRIEDDNINIGMILAKAIPVRIFPLVGSLLLFLLIFMIILFELILANYNIGFPIFVYFILGFFSVLFFVLTIVFKKVIQFMEKNSQNSQVFLE